MNTDAALEEEKALAARLAADLVVDGMVVGLGTGSTVAHLLPALAERKLRIRCIATSVETEVNGRELGLAVEPFEQLDRLDIAIDGADQVSAGCWLVKGGGGAHTREKIVAAAADRFVVIADSSKAVERIRVPIPLELSAFGLASTLRELGATTVRDAPPSPDGGVIADYAGELDDPARLAIWLARVPGVVQHGLFEPSLVSEVLIASAGTVDRLTPGER